MKKIFITLLTAICLAVPSFAQENSWFLSVGGGANISFEGYRYEGSTGVTPALSVGLGKWFNSNLGLKLGYDGMKLKNDKYFEDCVDCNVLSASFLWNASNSFGGEKFDRTLSIQPYAFVGAAMGLETSIAAGAGISFPIRLGNALSIVPDIKGTYLQDKIYSDEYNGLNLVVEPTVGLRYSF